MEQTAVKLAEPRSAGVGMEPETVLPLQFFDRTVIDASLQPEKRLMLAVLEDAVGAYQKYCTAPGRRAKRLFTEAEDWFLADDRQWPYSFANICEALGMNPEYLRAGLRRWRDNQLNPAIESEKIVRFPFRRVNGRRHSITGRPVGLRRSA